MLFMTAYAMATLALIWGVLEAEICWHGYLTENASMWVADYLEKREHVRLYRSGE